MRRIGLVIVAALSFFVALERPAAAHGAGEIRATNFRTTLGGVSPALSGLRVQLIDSGSRIELRNDGPDIIILGYDHEPYLKVGPDGSFENRQSPTAGLNRQTVHDRNGIGTGDATTAPDWRRIANAPIVRWHQHTTHWMAPRNPPEVAANPGARHVVYPRWEIELLRGDEKALIFGNLTWIPGPSSTPWLGLMAAAFLGVGALGLVKRWGRPLAVVTALVLTADLIHSASVAFASTGNVVQQLAKILTGNFYGIIGWALAVLAIRLIGRSKVDGLYAGVFAGLSLTVFGGLLDLATLSRSNSPSALPIDVVRLCVSLSAGAGLGLAAACLIVIQRTPDARRVVGRPAPVADEMPQETESR